MERLHLTSSRPDPEDEFARLVDGSRVDVGPGTSRSGARVVSLEVVGALGRLAAGLDEQATPDRQFRDQLRSRLAAESAGPADTGRAGGARGTLGSATARRRRWRPAIAVAGIAAAAVTVGGVVVRSGQSLPGEPLYALKRGTEALQLRAAGGSLDQGQRHLALAVVRYREVKELAEAGGTALGTPLGGSGPLAGGLAAGELASAGSDLMDTLQDMDSQTNQGLRLILAAAVEARDQQPLQQLRVWSAAQRTRIEQLLPVLPGAAQLRAQRSLDLTGKVADSAAQAITQLPCRSGCPSPGSSPTATTQQVPPPPASSADVAPPLPRASGTPGARSGSAAPPPYTTRSRSPQGGGGGKGSASPVPAPTRGQSPAPQRGPDDKRSSTPTPDPTGTDPSGAGSPSARPPGDSTPDTVPPVADPPDDHPGGGKPTNVPPGHNDDTAGTADGSTAAADTAGTRTLGTGTAGTADASTLQADARTVDPGGSSLAGAGSAGAATAGVAAELAAAPPADGASPENTVPAYARSTAPGA